MPPQKAPTKRQQKATRVLEMLAAAFPEAPCALQHRNAFELTAATILSAQCTDKRVNLVTPQLFARFPTAQAMATATLEELQVLVASTGFFRAKAKSLQGMARRVVEVFGGEIPRTLAELITLPGVARKTANVVLGVGYGLVEGVVVDTHVMRTAQRLGWSKKCEATAIERDLMLLLPRAVWVETSLRLICLGREVCIAAAPKCPACPLAELCPSAKLVRPASVGRKAKKPARKV